MPEITLGADPEMILTDHQGNLLHGHWTCTRFDPAGRNKFGQDTGGRTLELRPTPSPDPRQVVTRLKNIMKYACRKHPDLLNYKATAGSMAGYPLGGHIHLGIPYEHRKYISELVQALDYFLAIPLFLLEKPAEMRERGGYHNFGAYNGKDFGVEYRTPSSWLVSKGVALGTMCVAKIVGQEFVNRRQWVTALIDKRMDYRTWRDLYLAFEQAPFRSWLPDIQSKLSRFPLFPLYKSEVCFLWWLLKEKKTWDTEKSIFEKWKIASLVKKKE